MERTNAMRVALTEIEKRTPRVFSVQPTKESLWVNMSVGDKDVTICQGDQKTIEAFLLGVQIGLVSDRIHVDELRNK